MNREEHRGPRSVVHRYTVLVLAKRPMRVPGTRSDHQTLITRRPDASEESKTPRVHRLPGFVVATGWAPDLQSRPVP